MEEEGHLPPRDIRWTEASTPMEHGAPSEILPVERQWTMTLPHFPAYLILLLLVFFFLDKFCYYNFLVPF